MSKTGKIKKMVGPLIIVALIICGIVFVITLLKTEKRTEISNKQENDKVTAIYCKKNTNADVFFSSDKALSASHEVRITASADKADKFEFDFSAEYENDADAKTANAEMHAEYNIYMGGTDTYQEALQPIFYSSGNKNYVRLYTSAEDINKSTAQFFFINEDEINRATNSNPESLKKFYKSKGFVCN